MLTIQDLPHIIRFSEVNDLLGGISRRTLLRWEETGKFPRRIKLGEKSVGWVLEDVKNWISKKRN